ncbi:hypothetical protein CDL15_Pgr000835 [Punica granatum]|uniref:SBP-type domain-containing protein n=1 Tax=Punica granatum TaxID=22663 RepID=A0A218W4A8_PUNGR|nr:hypothetical protein CDL15_Pgr000835 [Punica granatum]
MEAKITGEKAQHFYGPVVSDAGVDRKSSEWDLNDWKWDGDLFRASPLGSAQLDYRSRQFLPIGPDNAACSSSFSKGQPPSLEDANPIYGSEKREVEKRRRGALIEDEELGEGAGCLSLKLGGQVYPVTDGDSKVGKKTKCVGPISISSAVVCQVEGCKADLSNSKDYHRRHKVCEMHSKAGEAIVGNVLQRFCQQCSRFHALQEFDEGKRSCRRRLAGHNRRRRKTHPDPIANGVSFNSERDGNYVLISLLRILANMQCNQQNISRLLQEAKNAVPSTGPESAKASGSNFQEPARPVELNIKQPSSDVAHNIDATAQGKNLGNSSTLKSMVQFPSTEFHLPQRNETEAIVGRSRINNFDLNNVCEEECMENLHKERAVNLGNGSPGVPEIEEKDYQRVSPAPNSSTSNSTSTGSPSSSSGEAQSRTDRIVFKLFGKDPNDLPHDLRKQILDWLSQSPTDIESYIRPGCIILTVYLRLKKSIWEELCRDLGSNLRRLLEASNDSFWRTGWVFTRVRSSVAFAYNGSIVLDTLLPLRNNENCRIAIIKPIAVSVSESAQFLVKGFNLLESTSRLLCTLEGKYLTQRNCNELIEVDRTVEDPDEPQCLTFRCSIPGVCGRGFIEVEDCSFNSSFFPFIIAEEEVCSEIRTLENAIDTVIEDHERAKARDQALDFINEMGWLLQCNHLKLRLKAVDLYDFSLFPLERFKWLVDFAVEKDWCAVVKKLLGILFGGVVGPEEHQPINRVLLDMGLLHRAVQRNCRAMVEFLLRYVPSEELGSEMESKADPLQNCYVFKPDAAGPGGLTPLHIAASTAGSDLVLDALTNDPTSVGLIAWKTARDNTGLTPNDYACLRRHYSYIHLVQRKINRTSNSGHSVVNIPTSLSGTHTSGTNEKAAIFETEKKTSSELRALQGQCRLCERQRFHYGTAGRTSLLYRPMMFSMVAIAAVCVCVALLFKSSPEVVYGFRPFRWERLKYGSM